MGSAPVIGEIIQPLAVMVGEKVKKTMTGDEMQVRFVRHTPLFTLVLILLFLVSCQPDGTSKGIQVMFDGRTSINISEVYHSNKSVGKITSRQMGKGSVEMVTIALAPEFKRLVGKHWAFYVSNGRLLAIRIVNTGHALKAEEKLCGFHSKAALNWFKFKTLLNDRTYKASLRAEQLYRRFS